MDMSNKVSFNSILVLNKESDIHDWILYNYSRRKGLSIREINIKDLKNSRLKYTSILDKKEIVLITGEQHDIEKGLKGLKGINQKRRMIAISCTHKTTLKKIEQTFKDNKVVEFPSVEQYQDRKNVVERLIDRRKMEFENQEVKKSLVNNMARSTVEWEDVFLMWSIYKDDGQVITLNDIEEIFEDNEFYNLRSFIFKVFKGKIKYKNYKVMSYYLDTKGYPPHWMMSKLREEYLNLGLFYQSYRGGVLLMPESELRIRERVSALGWEAGVRLTEFRDYEQENYLKFVKEVPYKYFLGIAKVLYKFRGNEEQDLYNFITELKYIRGKYDEDDGG